MSSVRACQAVVGPTLRPYVFGQATTPPELGPVGGLSAPGACCPGPLQLATRLSDPWERSFSLSADRRERSGTANCRLVCCCALNDVYSSPASRARRSATCSGLGRRGGGVSTVISSRPAALILGVGGRPRLEH